MKSCDEVIVALFHFSTTPNVCPGVAHYKQLYNVNADYETGFQRGKSGSAAPSGNLHLVTDKEQAEHVKEQHDRVKEAMARKQIAESDLVCVNCDCSFFVPFFHNSYNLQARMEEEKRIAEEKKQQAAVHNLSDKLANAGLAPK